ncbi:MAG TPA: hypothetical protein ENK60_07805, partial [Anaerolineae bacterium]|nr:hypothetical protein [Anaerolineae bacterium]
MSPFCVTVNGVVYVTVNGALNGAVCATVYAAVYATVFAVVNGGVGDAAPHTYSSRRKPMKNLNDLIDEFVLSCRAAGLNERTIQWYRSKLQEYLVFVGEDEAWDDHLTLKRFFADLQREGRRYQNHPTHQTQGKLSVDTIHGYGRTLKRFFNWLVEEGYLESSPMRRIRLPRRPKHVPKDVSRQD